jgi:hypothetical protein
MTTVQRQNESLPAWPLDVLGTNSPNSPINLRAFMMVWFLFAGIIGTIVIFSLVSGVAEGKRPPSELIWVLHPIRMLVFGCILILIGKLLSRNEKREIAEWLCKLFADSMAEVQLFNRR